ncbi:MAG: transglutaminase domain-containing protein [Deltaproteobacteria bacterium]|nr:transglutaminase domain-containing protein [Deltaproteobacteria bacterium]
MRIFRGITMTLFLLVFSFAIQGLLYAKERQGEVTFKINIEAPEDSKDVRLWLPYPVSDKEQTIEDVKIDGNFYYSGIYGQKQEGDMALYAEWTQPAKERFITLTFKAKAMERIKKDFPSKIPFQESGIPVEVKEYVKGSEFIPIDGKIKAIALKAIRGKKNIKDKAMAVYDWVIENTVRNPDIKGCGTGDVERILAEKGGKCADISGVYVAIARAAGIPAREVWGLRLGKKPEEDMTGGHHCWAEFYMPGYGWVPVDPADVRKAMLTEKLELIKDAKTKEYRDYYFGAVDAYRIVLTRGAKGYSLSPAQKDGVLPYGFMYPYAEIDGKAVEWLAAQKELKYKITFKEWN